MRISKVRKMYNTDFEKFIIQQYGEQFLKDYRSTYYWEKLSVLISGRDIYVRDYDRIKPKYRITFPLFIISILLINIFMCFRWFFIGSFDMNENWKITKLIIKWDRICNFNIV